MALRYGAVTQNPRMSTECYASELCSLIIAFKGPAEQFNAQLNLTATANIRSLSKAQRAPAPAASPHFESYFSLTL